jgi:hypothetical protein
LLLPDAVNTSSGAHQASYLMGIEVLFHWPGPYVDHSPPYTPEIQNEWSSTPTPLICLHGVGSDDLTVTCFQAQLQGLYNTRKDFAVYKLSYHTHP